MARIRTVFPTDEISHLWAHQSAQAARNPSHNFYFCGPTIYSYGGHFPIARIVEREGKGRAVLFTEHTYSKTTARHICRVRRAIPPHLRALSVPHVADAGREADNLAALVREVSDLLGKAYRARSNREWHLGHAAKVALDAQFLAEFYDLPAPQFPTLDLVGAKAIAEAQAAVAAEEKRQRIAREERRRADLEESMAAWLRGDVIARSGLWDYSRTCLRLSQDGANVQTSKGAEFPTEHARALWPLLVRMRLAGTRYDHNGHSIHLGDYRVDSFNGVTGELRAGCHTLEWVELCRFARVLGLDVPEEERKAA